MGEEEAIAVMREAFRRGFRRGFLGGLMTMLLIVSIVVLMAESMGHTTLRASDLLFMVAILVVLTVMASLYKNRT